MKNVKNMRAEYQREDLGKGVRGKYFDACLQCSKLVLPKPELEEPLTKAVAVNADIESSAEIAKGCQ